MEREIEIIDNDQGLTIIIPRIGHWVVIVKTGLWCLIWIFIFYALASDGMLFRDSDFMWHMAAFALLWFFVLRIFLWHVRGKEKITVDKAHLKISRLGTFLTSTRKYELSLIDNFRFTETNSVPWLSELYGFAGGHIAFDHWERPEYFGQTVSKRDAEEIVARLNESVKSYTQQ